MKGLAKDDFSEQKQPHTNTQISAEIHSKKAVKSAAVLTFSKVMAEGTHAGAIHTDIRHMVLLKRNTFFLSSACQGLFFLHTFRK